MTAAVADDGFYPAALHIDEMFVDPAYQRVPTDVVRARKYAAAWDRRLAGILEVSDRGESRSPRYAIIDGQHRWAAMGFLANPRPLVANVHTGLTVADEAALFDKLNRQRKQTNTWDHWKARRASGDPDVSAIEAVIVKHGLRIDQSTGDGCVSCTSALEKVVKLGGTRLLDDALTLIVGAWDQRRDGLEAQVIHGVSLVLHHLRYDVDVERLAETLIDVLPRQIKTQAAALREMTPGTLPTVTAIVVMNLYNKRPGRKIAVTHKTFGGTGIVNNNSQRPKSAATKTTQSRGGDIPAKPFHANVTRPAGAGPRPVPSDMPPNHPDTDTHGDAVMRLVEQDHLDDTAIATTLGIPERTVRRIRADLGLVEAV